MKPGPLISVIALLLPLTTTAPAWAGEQEAAALKTYCETQMNVKASICNCLLRQLAKLSDGQQALVVAIINKDQASIDDLTANLSPDEAKQSQGFLARESILCRPSG